MRESVRYNNEQNRVLFMTSRPHSAGPPQPELPNWPRNLHLFASGGNFPSFLIQSRHAASVLLNSPFSDVSSTAVRRLALRLPLRTIVKAGVDFYESQQCILFEKMYSWSRFCSRGLSNSAEHESFIFFIHRRCRRGDHNVLLMSLIYFSK